MDKPYFRSPSNWIFHMYLYCSIFYLSCGLAKFVNYRNLVEAQYVLLGISLDANSPVRTTSNEMIESLYANVSSVRSTGEAFAVRLRLTQEVNKEPPEADVKFAKMNDTFQNADYILWGARSKGGLVTGGVDLRSSGEWDGDAPHPKYRHNYVNFKDLCGMSQAFIGVRGDQIRCIGNADSCKGTNTLTGVDTTVAKKKVFCTDQQVAVVQLLYSYPTGATGSVLKLIGTDALTNLPTDAEFLAKWRAVRPDQIVDVKATSVGVAVLLNDQTVLSWKAGAPYLPSDASYVRFANKIVANKIGFVARLDTGKVSTWGEGIELGNIPRDITESGTETVADVYAYEECFVAKTTKHAIYTWGVGEVSYCHQSGGHTEGFTSYASVKDALSGDVETVVGNEKSLVAVKKDGSIITWGKNDFGGSSGPLAPELKWGVPETLVAIRDAYAITRADGRTICWGGVTSSYTGAISMGLSDSSVVTAASSHMFALVSKYKGSDLVVWTGADQGIYSADKDKTTANFVLPLTPRRLISSSGGIVAVLGKDCTYGPWSEFGKCDQPCGPGMKTRSREILIYALNGDCTFKTSESAVCDLGPCGGTETNETKAKLSTGSVIGLSAGGGVILLLAAGGLYVCCKNKTPEDQDYYSGGSGGYGGEYGYGGGNDWRY